MSEPKHPTYGTIDQLLVDIKREMQQGYELRLGLLGALHWFAGEYGKRRSTEGENTDPYYQEVQNAMAYLHTVEIACNARDDKQCVTYLGQIRSLILRMHREVSPSNAGLTFAQLRAANIARLPQFKNRHGQPAHSEPDGSDWSPAQWLQAVVGELGEYANLRKKFERGDICPEEFQDEAADELADVQTYLDILAFQLGINLGDATTSKFNRVSKRVCCDVKL